MTARAVLFEEAGTPLRVVNIDIPDLREGETLVKISCCSLCRSDLHTCFGRRQEPTPTILGHEIIGTVIDSRSDARVGDRVTWGIAASCGKCYFCEHGLPQKCGSLFKYGHTKVTDDEPLSGGLASHIILRAGTPIFSLPADLPDPVAVLANCSAATAAAVVRVCDPCEASTIVVLGAGVLGLTAIAMLRSRGCHVIAFDKSTNALERAREFGAEAIAGTFDELHQAISVLTEGRGADACLELTGAKSAAEESLSLVRIGGTVVWAGTTSPSGGVVIEPETVVRRMLVLKGVHNYAPEDLESAIAFLLANHENLPFADLVEDEFRLDDIEAAFEAAEAKPGKRVLVLPG